MLRAIAPPIPRMHSDLHPLDYERMSSLLHLAQRSNSNSPKDLSREHSYGTSPGSSRASSILSPTAGHGDIRSSASKLHQQLANLRARKPPRPVGPGSIEALSQGSFASPAEKRRVHSYTSGADEPMTRDSMLRQGSQTNLKVSMRRAVLAKRSPLHMDEDEVVHEEGKERTSMTRREVTTQSAVCLGPRLSNSRSVRLMMQMGLLRSESKGRRGSFGNKIVPERLSVPSNILPIASQKLLIPGEVDTD